MMNKEKCYLAFRATILSVLLLTMGFNLESFSMVERDSESGQTFIRINNNTNKLAYCVIIGLEMRYFKDFYLREYSKSRWYIQPRVFSPLIY